MPYMHKVNGKSVRNYKMENEKYNSKPSQIKARTERTTLRREAIKSGKASVGDGKDLDHKKPLSKGGANTMANARMVSPSANRSFSRNADGSLKSQTSKKEKKKK